MWNCTNCGASVDDAFIACNVCGVMRSRALPHAHASPQNDSPGEDPRSRPDGFELVPAFVPRIESPVASSLAAWVWIVAVFAFFPVLGVIPSLVLTACSALLLLRPTTFTWDRRIGIAGLAVAMVSLGITAVWVIMWFTSPPAANGETPEILVRVDRDWTVTAIQIAVLVMSIVLHECAHGVAALWSGDGTAARQGRLRLNPLVHVDPFGSVILPAILMMTPGGVVLGWAKPVPIDQRQFRHPRRGLLAVTLAGVSINMLLALMCTAGLLAVGSALRLAYPDAVSGGFTDLFQQKIMLRGVDNAAAWELVIMALKQGLLINVVLFSFNILPIPPLDGYGVLESLAPKSMAPLVAGLRPVGTILLLVLVFSGSLRYALLPGIIFGWGLNQVVGIMTGWM
ncbi:MAG: site-2 protease family protein [Pirellulaceae bacterium]